jgi:hypothetical protein
MFEITLENIRNEETILVISIGTRRDAESGSSPERQIEVIWPF